MLDLWGLFASFCVCADDCATAVPAYCSSIIGAMTDKTYPDLSITVCKGLTLLIRSNQLALEEKHEEKEEKEEDEEEDSESMMSEEEGKTTADDAEDEMVCLACGCERSFPSSPFSRPRARRASSATSPNRTSPCSSNSARTSS